MGSVRSSSNTGNTLGKSGQYCKTKGNYVQQILIVLQVFMYLTEFDGIPAFHYIFTITNSFQGALISAIQFYERRSEIRLLMRRVFVK